MRIIVILGCRNIDSILRIPKSSRRTSSIFCIHNIIALINKNPKNYLKIHQYLKINFHLSTSSHIIICYHIQCKKDDIKIEKQSSDVWEAEIKYSRTMGDNI